MKRSDFLKACGLVVLFRPGIAGDWCPGDEPPGENGANTTSQPPVCLLCGGTGRVTFGVESRPRAGVYSRSWRDYLPTYHGGYTEAVLGPCPDCRPEEMDWFLDFLGIDRVGHCVVTRLQDPAVGRITARLRHDD